MSSASLSFPGTPATETSYNQSHSLSFRDTLSGDHAFYNQPDYLEVTQRDFAKNETLPVSYTWNTENKIIRIAKQILFIIIFPIAIYGLLQALAAKFAILPASNPWLMEIIAGCPKNFTDVSRSMISFDDEWKYKRKTIEVNGYRIDTAITGKAATLNNGRWVLVSLGNGECYEDTLCDDNFKEFLSAVNGNAIVFNYPGVGTSSGLPNRQAMAKAYQALLNFLEDQKNGAGAREIIGYGHSIGGGVQGDALKTHPLKKDIKYVFVKSRTFSDLSTAASTMTIKPFGFLVKLLGWNMDSVESSKKLLAPEIIMQTANVEGYEEINDSSKIIDDGVIRAKASLAKALLDDDKCPRQNKVFIGMKERHMAPLIDPSFLARKIDELFRA
jgi:hypothetical protein